MEAGSKSERHWSTVERATFIILITILSFAGVFFAWAIYGSTLPCENPGCPPSEALTIESSQVTSPTSVTLTLRNLGYKQAALVTCYVKDAGGDTYSQNFSPQPVLNTNSQSTISIVLSNKVSGQSFTFQQGKYYTIVMITARNNQFTYTLTA
jgi:hypothetical protein